MMTMMHLRLIYLVILFYCCISYTNTQHVLSDTIDGYDTKTLTSATQWQVTIPYNCLDDLATNCTYFISFSQPAPMCFDHYSACENSTKSTNMTIIGDFTPKLFYENKTEEQTFYAKFLPGPLQNISNATNCTPSLLIKFRCNLDAVWVTPLSNLTANAPKPLEAYSDPNDTCETVLIFEYSGACKQGEKEPDNGISPGALFLIILFSCALIYFFVGAAYNGLVKHRSGVNLLPHAQFWIGFPLHAIEGCRAVLTCCSGTPKPSRATYESV